MYAVIKTGSHQYRVKEKDKVTVEKLAGKPGDKISFEPMMLGGSKLLLGEEAKGAKVEAVIKEHTRADKVIVFKYKRRKNYKVHRGHKQHHSVIEITKIKG